MLSSILSLSFLCSSVSEALFTLSFSYLSERFFFIDSYDFSGPRSERIGEWTNGTRWYGMMSPNLTYLEVIAEFTLGEG